MDEVVCADHFDQFAPGLLDGGLPVLRQRDGLVGADVADAGVVELRDDLAGAVRRAVVSDHNLEVGIFAGQHRSQSRCQS